MPPINIIIEGAKYWSNILKDKKISMLILEIEKKLQDNVIDLILIKKLENKIEQHVYNVHLVL